MVFDLVNHDQVDVGLVGDRHGGGDNGRGGRSRGGGV